MLTVLFDLPSSSDFFSGLTAWSSPMFDALLPFAYLIMGISIAVGIIAFIMYMAGSVFHRH